MTKQHAPASTERRARTVIIYLGHDSTVINGGHDIVLLIVTAKLDPATNNEYRFLAGKDIYDPGIRLYKLRECILDKFSPLVPGYSASIPKRVPLALNLDGGWSTQMAYKENNQRFTVQGIDETGNYETVNTMIAIVESTDT